VLDGGSGEPLAGAFLVLVNEHSGDGWVQASATADAHGRAALDALDIGPGIQGELWLRVQFPGYAPAWTAVQPDTASVEVRMGRGGAVHARLLAPALPAVVGLMLLEGAGGTHAEEAVYSLRLDASGEGTLAQLTPGRWQYQLLEGWERDASVLALLEKSAELPDDAARGEFEIREGETTELVLGRQAEPSAVETVGGGTGVLHGTLRIDGAPARGRVSVQHEGVHDPDSIRYLKLDARGAFEFRDLPAGPVAFVYEDQEQEGRRGPSSMLVQPFDLVPGEERAADLRYESIGLDLEVVVGDLEPVNEASVTLDCRGDDGVWFRFTGETDRAGRIHVPLLQQGTCRIMVARREVGLTRTEIQVGSAPVEPLVIALEAGVPCAGRIEIPGADGSFHLFFTTIDAMWIGGTKEVELAGGSGEFSVQGLPPGAYQAQLYSRDREDRFSPLRVELGPNGDRELRLRFQPFEARPGVVER
jgi:hypothetical protein